MRKLSIAALAAILVGCGGSTGGSTATETPIETGGTANQYGTIATRGQVKGTPIVRDLGRISTVALAGVLSEATYRPQGQPDNETAIAVGGGKEIRYYMESGEFVGSFRPSNLAADDVVVLPTFSADGSKLYFFGKGAIYSVNVASPDTATAVISAANMNRFAISPDGLKIAYNRIPPGETDQEVYVRDIAGGPTKRLTNNATDDYTAVWIDNDRVAVRHADSDPALQGTNIISATTLASTPYTPFTLTVFPIARTANGRVFLNSSGTSPDTGLSLTDFDLEGLGAINTKDYLDDSGYNGYSGSLSPDGTRWVVNGQMTYTTELAPQTTKVVAPQLPFADQGVSWQPALGVTKFVGTGGKHSTAAAGVIATNRSGIGRNGLASFVSWDAETRTTSTVSDDSTSPGVGSKSYTIEADRLTALRYSNRPLFQGVNTVNAGGTANGAIVTVDAEDGLITSIVVFQETRGAKPSVRQEGGRKIVEGAIQSVWDVHGHNLAPQGASRVEIPESGAPTVG